MIVTRCFVQLARHFLKNIRLGLCVMCLHSESAAHCSCQEKKYLPHCSASQGVEHFEELIAIG